MQFCPVEEIQEWFSGGKDFQAGLILYSKYGPYESVYNTLKNLGENQVTKKTLQDHLRRVADNMQKATPAPAPVIAKKEQTAFDASEHRQKANKVYSEMGAVHSRILATKEQSERAAVMRRFHALHKEWCSLMHQVEYFEEHGKLPEAVQPTRKKTSASQLTGNAYKELCLLRSKVTRAEREQIPKYQLEKKDAKLKSRLADVELWKKRIAELENAEDGNRAE